MSVDYAAGLSHCDDLGDCGLDEVIDKREVVQEKVKLLASWLRLYEGSCVVHAGAGISTSAGIRDFRGKHGVWTELLRRESAGAGNKLSAVVKEEPGAAEGEPPVAEGVAPPVDEKVSLGERELGVKPFSETEPTFTHMALKELCKRELTRHIISQNVDGLFLKANLARKFISELHGNFYLDECTKCRSRFIRATPSETMRLSKSSVRCLRGIEVCKGFLRDTILDWESPIPHNELRVATREGKQNLLHICVGTSMQLRPSKDLVCDPTKGGPRRSLGKKLVVINLQPTKMDRRASLVINYYADEVMRELMSLLEIDVPAYSSEEDPTKDPNMIGSMWRK